jgi:hypothetical protein
MIVSLYLFHLHIVLSALQLKVSDLPCGFLKLVTIWYNRGDQKIQQRWPEDTTGVTRRQEKQNTGEVILPIPSSLCTVSHYEVTNTDKTLPHGSHQPKSKKTRQFNISRSGLPNLFTSNGFTNTDSHTAVLLNSFKFCAPVVFAWFWLFLS